MDSVARRGTVLNPSLETSRSPGETVGSVLAAFVAEHLGLDLAAYVTGVDEKLVGRWIEGEVDPEPLPLGRLRAAYEATRLIVNLYDGETAQSWFSGMNPWLDDDAPGYVLRHGNEPESWEPVVEASQDFVEFAR
jgi:hypothetical protein